MISCFPNRRLNRYCQTVWMKKRQSNMCQVGYGVSVLATMELVKTQVECPTRALKTWKLEPELEISSSSRVKFNHYQFQVFKFKTWRTWKFQVKFDKLQTWTRFIKIYCQMWQKCAHMGLNGFHIKCIIGIHCNWKIQILGALLELSAKQHCQFGQFGPCWGKWAGLAVLFSW